METTQLSDDVRASKKPRVGEPVDSRLNDVVVTSIPELDRIKQSDNQLAYLQSQLAATESLYAAYQDEFRSLAKQLSDVKRSQLKNGLEIWAVAGASGDAAVQWPPKRQGKLQPSAEGSWDYRLETLSDIEEEVLFIEPDSPMDEDPPRDPDSVQPCLEFVSPTAEGGTLPPAALADKDGGTGRPPADHIHADGTTSAAPATAPGSQSPVAGDGGNVVDRDVRMSEAEGTPLASTSPASVPTSAANTVAAAAVAEARAGPGTSPRDRLEALEATCSAVAQEDMEAQGALACLAGRHAKYYLRSTAVTLGRTTESKGDVDVDLTPEEPPPPAAATAAAAAAGTVGPHAGTGGTVTATGATAAPTGGAPQAASASAAAAGIATAAPGATGTVAGGGGGGGGGGDQAPAPALDAAAASGPGAVGSRGPAARGHLISRRQAMIRLGADGQFRLVNMGRQVVRVNDILVPQNHTVNLPHLSLIEIASVRLLFMANLAAVVRVMRRSAALSL
ncbi:hypothetical protein VaNZ11_010060 [Volvox africanus]|uniref:FHA domain-containing protein n=1 Tax=Volvox africanus TaxID=51714 RepID=A0ABQ5SA11_9CHLO|nr:hypothetical protein VaNZ11_010060 [Volvox africanus]